MLALVNRLAGLAAVASMAYFTRVDGGWSQWNTVACGKAAGCARLTNPATVMTRTCTDPAPSRFGRACAGASQIQCPATATCSNQDFMKTAWRVVNQFWQDDSNIRGYNIAGILVYNRNSKKYPLTWGVNNIKGAGSAGWKHGER